jgi:hypothetical protein
MNGLIRLRSVLFSYNLTIIDHGQQGTAINTRRVNTMFKKTIIAATALVAAFVAFQPVQEAEAKVNLHIGIGVPGYYGGGYYGPGYYEPDYYVPRRRYRPRPRYVRKLSCRQARRIVARHRYHNIRAVDCGGVRYGFHAKRNGRWYRMRMNARTGHIYSVHYLY